MRRIRFEAKIEPRDAWIGLFWDRRPDGLHFFVCPLPFVVLHATLIASPELPRCEEGCHAPAVFRGLCRVHARELDCAVACEACDRIFDPLDGEPHAHDPESGADFCAKCTAEMRDDAPEVRA
jgi:hypothetical protein